MTTVTITTRKQWLLQSVKGTLEERPLIPVGKYQMKEVKNSFDEPWLVLMGTEWGFSRSFWMSMAEFDDDDLFVKIEGMKK